jgi:hypothetical protein
MVYRGSDYNLYLATVDWHDKKGHASNNVLGQIDSYREIADAARTKRWIAVIKRMMKDLEGDAAQTAVIFQSDRRRAWKGISNGAWEGTDT